VPPEIEPVETEPVATVPTVVAKMNVNCREGPGTNYGIYGSLLEGQEAEIKGRLSDNSWLLIALADRSINCWIASSVADVRGDLGKIRVAAVPPPPATEPPPVDEPPPAEPPPPVDILPPEPIDNVPPSFSTVAASPNTIWVNGCPDVNTTAVVAVVTDESGISSVTAHWSIGGESGQKSLAEYALGWGATIGPVSTKGTMNIYFVARDVSDSKNSATSNNVNVTVKHCVQ
jgi:uncharacterized protein YgiM (DUF1202 family)